MHVPLPDRSWPIYLAGPDVFLPNAVHLGAAKKALCEAAGFTGLFPLDSDIPPGAGQDAAIYRANARMMAAATFGIFNLTPFRGPSADVGTVFELGLMAGMGKTVFGYTNDPRPARARVPHATLRPNGDWRDAQDLLVEDFGNADNLMIDHCLAASGHPLVRIDAGGKLDDLTGFATCLALAATLRDKTAPRTPPPHRTFRPRRRLRDRTP
jgi:nucleoside 2-deoxyribosyltransferase